MNLWHLLRICRTSWFVERYICGSCCPELLE